MALAPGDIPVTREMVHSWLSVWEDSDKEMSVEDTIRMRVDGLELADDMVNTGGHESLSDEMKLADFIIMDLESYT